MLGNIEDNKLLAAVCEDDDAEYAKLQKVIEDLGIDCTLDRFSEGQEFLDHFYADKYDLVFMDIYMNGLNGVDAVSRLRQIDSEVPVAFVTTSQEFALDGYRLKVNRYILKPYAAKDIEDFLKEGIEYRNNIPGICANVAGKEVMIPYRQIRYMEQHDHNVDYFLSGNRVITAKAKLSELDKILPHPPFLMCHKSYIVNMLFINSFDKSLSVFEMCEGGTVYIRRASLKEAEDSFEKLMFSKTRT